MRRNILSLFGAGLLSAVILTGCIDNQQSNNMPQDPQPQVQSQVESAQAQPQEETTETLWADIVIIGAGGAGMTAALQAYQEGAKNIVILEKMPMPGGNTVRATGGMNAAATTFQAPDSDSADLMFQDTMTGGGNINNPDLVRIMADQSAEAIYWVNDFGAGFTRVGRSGGTSADRVHGPEDGRAGGPTMVSALTNAINDYNIPIMLNTNVTEILVNEDGSAAGVVAERNGEVITINSSAVILASGGFGANPEMLVYYNPALLGFGTTNHSGATGSGIILAQSVGAALVDMEQIQTHPTVHPETSIMYTEAIRGDGAILINMEGKRFINELSTRAVVSEATLAQTDNRAFLIFDSRIRQNLSVIESYINYGIITSGESPRELAQKLGIDPVVFEETLARYNSIVDTGNDDDFGRTASLHKIEGPSYYAGVTVPAVHHTMGGVVINTNAEVIDNNGNVISGLYAAGEVTGGIHGNNRIGGNALADIVIFGRIAGTNAAQFVSQTAGFTAPTIVVEAPAQQTVVPTVSGDFEDGVFEGTAQGFGGPVHVRVTVEGGSIVRIDMFEHQETPNIYEAAERGVINSIISAQSVDVDVVAGATRTSSAIIGAVENALGLR